MLNHVWYPWFSTTHLAFWRKRIVSIGILCSDPTISSVNQAFRLLMNGNGSCYCSSFRLCCCVLRSSGITGAFYLPTALWVRSHMLTFSHADYLQFGTRLALAVYPHLGQRTFPPRATTISALPQDLHSAEITSPIWSFKTFSGCFFKSDSTLFLISFSNSFMNFLESKLLLKVAIAAPPHSRGRSRRLS